MDEVRSTAKYINKADIFLINTLLYSCVKTKLHQSLSGVHFKSYDEWNK